MFNEFFKLSLDDYVKYLNNLKNTEENKKIVTEAKHRISDLKDRIKKNEQKRKKNKNADEAPKIIEEILNYNETAQTFFPVVLEVDKGKSKPIPEESISKRVN